jgi:AAA+ ATPase superfamily predicted ATPase
MVTAADEHALDSYLGNATPRPMLGLVYGRRRIGKSTLLVDRVRRRGGFYYEATRVEGPMQLRRLGQALGEHLTVGGPVALDSWDAALAALLALGRERSVPVVLDEFGHILDADPSVDSVIAAAIGPGAASDSTARLVLCGSAIAMMRSLTTGEAPLRGRASLELVMQPDDYRTAATRLPDPNNLDLAVRVHSFIGGVVGYATDMVGHDLPATEDDLDRWVCERVLSPASPLHHEATTLLAEDPTLGGRSATTHHSILGAIAQGAVTFGTISRAVGKSTGNLAPFLNRLVDAGFVVRLEDPVRQRRALYALSDPYLQVHYAVLDPHRAMLRARQIATVWHDRLREVHSSKVRGPVFEQQARTWVEQFASEGTLGGPADYVGPSSVSIEGTDHELDVVVATGEGDPTERQIVAIGEAKAGETITVHHVRRLERARAAFGPRAAGATLLLFGATFDLDASPDVQLVDLSRLYHGE